MKVQVADLESLPKDQGVRVTVGEHTIAMFRIGDEVYAIADRCSHAQASLSEGEIFECAVECPRHGSEFDLRTGEPHSLPATAPVAVYSVSVEDGTIYLELEDE